MKKQTKRGSSIALTRDELTALKNYRKGFTTEVECAISIGIDRTVLNRVMTFGSGSPATIQKIKEVIGNGSKEILEAEPVTAK